MFSTNPSFETDEKSGDNRVFSFRFTIIAEGTAPGPKINRQRLDDYAKLTVSDAYPIYYGLTFHSAAKGLITYAFATEKAAVDFAYEYETKDYEIDEDGNYKYKGTSTIVDGEYQYNGSFEKQKETYADGWTLADAIQNYAEQSVQRTYFDYGNKYTISDDILSATVNPRQLELEHSVVVFSDATQKGLLTDLNTLPFISNKEYLYSVPGDGGTDSGAKDFEFKSDIYGADSYEVLITDSFGKEYSIEYDKSVDDQLADANCPSGVITIVETTKYGKKCDPYPAIYIAKGVNTGRLTVSYNSDGASKLKEFSQEDCSDVISCDGFTISSIKDELDPYGLVTIKDSKGNVSFFAADERIEEQWILEGTYTIAYKNRLGYGYSFNINVNENNNVVIAFDGASSEELNPIVTEYGSRNVSLPVVKRSGYDFAGYIDSDGNIYENEIASILFKGQLVLNTTWKPKKFVFSTVINNEKQDYDILYGQQIDIPQPVVLEGYEFIGWTLDGEDYTEKTFQLKKEEDTVITANLKKINAVNIVTDAPDIPNENDKNPDKLSNTIWIVLAIVLICIMGGIGAFAVIRRKNAERNEGNEVR